MGCEHSTQAGAQKAPATSPSSDSAQAASASSHSGQSPIGWTTLRDQAPGGEHEERLVPAESQQWRLYVKNMLLKYPDSIYWHTQYSMYCFAESEDEAEKLSLGGASGILGEGPEFRGLLHPVYKNRRGARIYTWMRPDYDNGCKRFPKEMCISYLKDMQPQVQVNRIIDLGSQAEIEAGSIIRREELLARGIDVQIDHYPVADYTVPLNIFEIVQRIVNAIERDEVLILYCLAGEGRTGTILLIALRWYYELHRKNIEDAPAEESSIFSEFDSPFPMEKIEFIEWNLKNINPHYIDNTSQREMRDEFENILKMTRGLGHKRRLERINQCIRDCVSRYQGENGTVRRRLHCELPLE